MKLTRDQVNTIIKNAPAGSDKTKLLDGLITRGYELEGVNTQEALAQINKKQQVIAQEEANKPKGFEKVVGKIADFTGGKELAQGIATAINLPRASKQLDDMLEQATTQQSDLLAKRKEIKTQGGDTSGIDKALKINAENLAKIGAGAEAMLNPYELTNKQVIGDALQLGTTLVGAGTLPSAGAKVAGAKTVGQGIVQGAKTGAITGGTYGTATGVSQGLQKDKDLGGIIKEGLMTGVGGAVTGGILGGVTGGISGAIKSKGTTNIVKQEKNAMEAITPDVKNISKKEYEKLLEQGRIKSKTGVKGSQYILSESEKQTALKYKNLLKSKDPVKNITNLFDEISKKDDEVGSFLRQNNGIFNSGELKNSLKSSMKDITDISIDEKVINRNKQRLIDNFINKLDKNDMESLWKARKEFDREIEKSFTGSPTLQNKIKREFRNSIQNFIADRTPDEVYKTSMKEMSNLYKLERLLKVKANSEKGRSAIRLWMKNNPIKTKIIGIGAPSLVGGAMVLD